MTVKLIMLVAFFAVMVAVGIFCRRHTTNVSGFLLGGRSVGPWLSAFAYGTTYFSAVIFIGYAGQFGWRFGISAIWIGLGNALLGSLLVWLVLGRRTRIMTQHLDSNTMPSFFGKRYNSPALKIGGAVITFVFLIPYTASLYNGLTRLFSMAFHIDYTICIVVMALLTCTYVVAGGYMATAVNDFIQGIIMLGGIVAVIVFILGDNGGFSAAFASLSAVQDPAVSSAPGAFTSIFGPEPLNLLGVIILTSLGTWGLPHMVSKFYAIKDEKSISKAAVISTLFAIVVAGGCYFLGSFGRLYPIDVAASGYDAIIPKMLESLPNALIAIVVILVLSASMSTLSGLVLTSSSTLTLDLLKDHVIKKMNEKRQVWVMRILLVFFIAVSSAIAIVQYLSPSTFIAQMMGLSWGTLAGAFLAPFLYGLYWKRATKASAWACFGFSVVVMLLNFAFKSSFPVILRSSINCGVVVMLSGFIIVPLVSLFTKAPEEAFVKDVFSCYKSH